MRTTLVVALVLVLATTCSGGQESRRSSHPIEVQDGITFTGGWNDAFH